MVCKQWVHFTSFQQREPGQMTTFGHVEQKHRLKESIEETMLTVEHETQGYGAARGQTRTGPG